MTDTDAPDLLTLLQPQEETICEFGDIILVADDGFYPTLKIRVSSCIIAMSSKPLKALFSNKYSECKFAEERSADKPHEVALKDAPVPLKHLCRLLHHQYPISDKDDENELSPSMLLDLAVIADKYDCVDALKLPTDALLARHVDEDFFFQDGELDILTAASYLLDQPQHFRRFTRQMVLNENHICAKTFHQQSLDILSYDLVNLLQSQQNLARIRLTEEVTGLINDFTEAARKVHREELAIKLLSGLAREELWPLKLTKATLGLHLWRLERVEIPIISTEEQIPGPGSSYRSEDDWDAGIASTSRLLNAPNHRTVIACANEVCRLCVGACLQCIKRPDYTQEHEHDPWGEIDDEFAVQKFSMSRSLGWSD
ncbi:Hypothetical predicted protein [Lecanosticta acicola]|uniref:BTB domain-containing protein n=1 Tax=Lecanosticta acicola TaxID=111012 RepID=A0AAI8YSK3_9PEZI|nr:Hypothetical predicted protein [Lecanosticta acicola]